MSGKPSVRVRPVPVLAEAAVPSTAIEESVPAPRRTNLATRLGHTPGGSLGGSPPRRGPHHVL